MEDCNSERQVLILDCCYSGTSTKGTKGAVDVDSAFLGSGYGNLILTATNAVQEALEANQIIADAQYSLFTHYLIEGLKSRQLTDFLTGTLTDLLPTRKLTSTSTRR